MGRADEIRERWGKAAPRWRAHGQLVREMTAPVTEALLEAAEPRPGERWLDVAGGVGDPAIPLARRVGRRGAVVVTDLVHEMVDAARGAVRAAGGRGLAVTAAAEALPFGSPFHGVSCRFGAMFFADPPAALAEIHRVTGRRGRAVFAVWAGPERNPFFRVVNEALEANVPDLPEPDPDAPGVFRFAGRGRLAELVRAAGWEEVEETALPFALVAPIPRDVYWDRLLELSVELAELLETLPAETRDAVRADLESRVAPYFFPAGTLQMPAEAILVTARR